MALFRRFFYKKPPDHLLEISERLYGKKLPPLEDEINSILPKIWAFFFLAIWLSIALQMDYVISLASSIC